MGCLTSSRFLAERTMARLLLRRAMYQHIRLRAPLRSVKMLSA
jgi:hypothetical protein